MGKTINKLIPETQGLDIPKLALGFLAIIQESMF